MPVTRLLAIVFVVAEYGLLIACGLYFLAIPVSLVGIIDTPIWELFKSFMLYGLGAGVTGVIANALERRVHYEE